MIFNSLKTEDLSAIVRIEVATLLERMESIHYHVEINQAAIDFIAKKGHDPKYGARPLARAVQKYVEDPMAEDIVNGKVKEGDNIRFTWKSGDEKLTLKVVKAKKKAQKSPTTNVLDADVVNQDDSSQEEALQGH